MDKYKVTLTETSTGIVEIKDVEADSRYLAILEAKKLCRLDTDKVQVSTTLISGSRVRKKMRDDFDRALKTVVGDMRESEVKDIMEKDCLPSEEESKIFNQAVDKKYEEIRLIHVREDEGPYGDYCGGNCADCLDTDCPAWMFEHKDEDEVKDEVKDKTLTDKIIRENKELEDLRVVLEREEKKILDELKSDNVEDRDEEVASFEAYLMVREHHNRLIMRSIDRYVDSGVPYTDIIRNVVQADIAGSENMLLMLGVAPSKKYSGEEVVEMIKKIFSGETGDNEA
jgi:hypothetical protein